MTPSHLPLLLTGAFLTSLVLSLSGTYLVRGWAIRKGFVDHPDGARRIHTAPTPNVGGVAIVVASLLSFVLWGGVADPDMLRRPEILSMLGGGALIFLLGFWDDTHQLRARTKFAFQSLIAVLVFLGAIPLRRLLYKDAGNEVFLSKLEHLEAHPEEGVETVIVGSSRVYRHVEIGRAHV